MDSPFPGIDPYLEQFWGDIHTRLIVYAGEQIEEQLPPDLQARVEESADEPVTQRHLEIIDPNSGNRVVTAVEVLSPANKTTESGRQQYRQKQRDYIQARVNLVEIDLIRAGSFLLALPERVVPADCRTPYLICVRRAAQPQRAELYPLSLREPLPGIRLPLRPTDADITLSLQPLLDRCYRVGRYAKIDYRQPPRPPLGEEDERWADARLREQGRR